MGCDIHTCVEVRKTINDVKKWVSADHFSLNSYYDGVDEYEQKYNVVEIFGDRNYHAFSNLCGVRRYIEDSPRISDPKGIPDDCCKTIKDRSDRDGSDGHSHSYVTLRDVVDFLANNKGFQFTGIISAEQASALDNDGEFPAGWCQATNQKDYVRRTWFDKDCNPLEPLKDEMIKRMKEAMWVWSDDDIEANLDNIRLVFWFDN